MSAVSPSRPADAAWRPRAVLFDVYGTLLDVHSVAARAESLFPGAGERLSQLWRTRQIDYSRLVSMAGRYRPFSELTRDALGAAADALGLALDEAAAGQLMAEYERLAPFAETVPVLQALRERGVRCGVLSNGDPPLLAASLAGAGLAGLLDPVLSVHPTGRYKTDPATYALGPAALGLDARAILFVSANAWDAVGATWFGYATLWVNRAGVPPERLGVQPARAGTSLHAVVDDF